VLFPEIWGETIVTLLLAGGLVLRRILLLALGDAG